MPKRMRTTRPDVRPLKVPKSLQKSIPITRIFRDGGFLCGNKYSKTWRFADINYSVASDADQLSMFMDYCHALNALPADASFKITIFDRRIKRAVFESNTLMPYMVDGLDHLRREYNGLLTDKAAESNNIVQEKYITVSVERKSHEEARSYFNRVGNELSSNFSKLSSKVRELSTDERLQLFHDFFREGDGGSYRLNVRNAMRLGQDFRDYICPDGLQYRADHFEMSGRFGRVLFLKDFPSFLKDSMISELTEFYRSMMLSIDILPVPTDEAVKEVQKRVLGIETEVTRWQQKQNQANNWSTEPPYELTQMREEMKEYMDDLTKRDQRMLHGQVTLVHMADTLEELDQDTETLLAIGSKYMCQFGVQRYQQEDGLNTVLPYGLRLTDTMRTLTTESMSVMMPFSSQEVQHRGGIYCGVNARSKNIISIDRSQLLNPHGFVLGVSGSGKSVTMKHFILYTALTTQDEIFILDIEREYAPLVEAVGGEVIKLSPNSPHRINMMEASREYAAGDNLVHVKSELLMAVVEQQMGNAMLGPKEKSIIDRCVRNAYSGFVRNYSGKLPTMMEVYEDLHSQKEVEAQDIALMMELFTTGSLNIFAADTNVDIRNRITCFDLHELGQQLERVGHAVVLDFLGNRVAENFEKGIRTHIFADEAHMYFANNYSALFFNRAYKRYRKKNAWILSATQNISELLVSDMARLMLSNSEFLVLLNQSASDRQELAKLLNISDTQMSYITNSEAGSGLVKVQGALVPFVNRIPTGTDIYRLMSTKPGEG
ncbi:ATP-binding protein [Ruminococcaceae bacterium OttesenSCG-928-A11]|nr:ATP-binding protein [Ruminococcaceae bacterium OttesenSCG-928-A11]